MSLERGLLFSLLFVYGFAVAEVFESGSATVDMKGRKASGKEVRAAVHKAKIRAVENYLGESQVKIDLYDRCLRPEIDERVDDYVTDHQIIRNEADNSSRQLRVVIKAAISDTRLDNHLRRCKPKVREKNRIAFVFVARQRVAGAGYEVIKSNNALENSVKAVFLENAFQVTSSAQMELRSGTAYRKDRLEKDYLPDGDVDWVSAIRAAEVSSNDFFAYGTLDVGAPSKDAKTGLYRVAVIMNAELLDLFNQNTLAVIGNVQSQALGATIDEATTKARLDVSQSTAKRMVAQLNAQGIQ